MITIRWRGRVPRRVRADRLAKIRSGALRGAAVAVVLAGMAGSVLVAQEWRSTVTRQRVERLDRTAASRTITITNAMANYENALQAARSLWLASSSVSRSEFNAFARSLDLEDRYAGLQGIGWRSLVTDGEKAEFVARTRSDGEAGFTIRPPGRRPVYYVTLFSYPRLPSSTPVGADARANPGVLATLDEARDSGKTTLSNQITLPGDLELPSSERPVAFELFVPVYEEELRPHASVAERRRHFVGWATGQFRARDFLVAALRTAQPTTGVELHDPQARGRHPDRQPSCRVPGPRPPRAGGLVQLRGADLRAALRPPARECDPDRAHHPGAAGARNRVRDQRPARRPAEEAAGLVARADRALYAAKEAGRDRCLADQAPATAATSTAPSRSS